MWSFLLIWQYSAKISACNAVEGCSLIRSFLWSVTQNCIGSISNAFIGHSLICTFCSNAPKSTNRSNMSKLSRRQKKGSSLMLKNKIKFSEAACLQILMYLCPQITKTKQTWKLYQLSAVPTRNC